MKYKDYSTLKAASKLSFKKIAAVDAVDAVYNADGSIKTPAVHSQNAYTVIERKAYDPNTVAESTVDVSALYVPANTNFFVAIGVTGCHLPSTNM